MPAGFPPEVFERRGPWGAAWPALLGRDADTYGAVAAPIVAAAHGSVPTSLTDGLVVAVEFDTLAGVPDADQ